MITLLLPILIITCATTTIFSAEKPIAHYEQEQKHKKMDESSEADSKNKWSKILSIQGKRGCFSGPTYPALLYLTKTSLVAGTNRGTIERYNVETGECEQEIKIGCESVLALAHNTKTGDLISGSFDRTIRIHTSPKYREVTSLTGHTGYISTLLIGNRNLLISGSSDGTIKFWNIAALEKSTEAGDCCRATIIYHKNTTMSSIALLKKAQLASTAFDPYLMLWDIMSQKKIRAIPTFTTDCMRWVISMEDRNILACADGKTIVLLDGRSHKPHMRTLDGHTINVRQLAVLSDNSLLSSDGTNTIKVWDVRATAHCSSVVVTSGTKLYTFADNPSSKSFATSTVTPGTIEVWHKK